MRLHEATAGRRMLRMHLPPSIRHAVGEFCKEGGIEGCEDFKHMGWGWGVFYFEIKRNVMSLVSLIKRRPVSVSKSKVALGARNASGVSHSVSQSSGHGSMAAAGSYRLNPEMRAV